MQKTIIVLILLISGTVGYLIYDWHAKIKAQVAEPGITLYTWTDEEGNKHFTDTVPPQGARNVQKSMGYKHVDPPLIVVIRDKTIEIYRSLKSRIFDAKDSKKKSRREERKQPPLAIQPHGVEQSLPQARITLLGFVVMHRDCHGFAAADNHHQVFATGDRRIDQIALQ
jgi:hypothetical protein